MKSATTLRVLTLATFLAACSVDNSTPTAAATACAVYEAMLQDWDTDLSPREFPPAIVLAAATSSITPALPSWNEWRATREVDRAGTTELGLAELTALNVDGRIDCQLEALPHWSAIHGDEGRSGWLRSPGTLGQGSSYAELRLTPVYLSPDGRVAMVSSELELIDVMTGTALWQDLPANPSVRLELDDTNAWIVTGRHQD